MTDDNSYTELYPEVSDQFSKGPSVDYHNQIEEFGGGHIQVQSMNCVTAHDNSGTIAEARRKRPGSAWFIESEADGDVAMIMPTIPEVLQRKLVHAILKEIL